MQRILLAAKISALIALIVFLLQFTLTLHGLTAKVDYTLDNANRAIRESAQTVANLRHATAEWERASQQQALNATAASLAAKKSFEDFDVMVRRTDFQLNERVLPQIGQAIEANSTQLVELEKTSANSFERIARDADELTASSTAMMQAAQANLNDPAIPETLRHVEEISEQTAATAKDIRTVTDKLTADFLKPQKMLWTLFKDLVGVGGNLAQMIR